VIALSFFFIFNVQKYAESEIYRFRQEYRRHVKAERPVDCCMLSCRFSLSDAGADVARQLRDAGDAPVSKPLVCAAPEIISIDISDDERPTTDGTAAGDGEIAASLVCDNKEYPTLSAAISVKRKATAAKTRDYETSHLNSVSTCNLCHDSCGMVATPHFYSGAPGFKSWPGDWLS
jgi:hypothetical protein